MHEQSESENDKYQKSKVPIKLQNYLFPFKVRILEASILAISVVSFKSLLALFLSTLPESLSNPNQNMVSLADLSA